MTLPEEFIHYTKKLMGDSLWQAFYEGLKSEAPVSIRVNPFKVNHGRILYDSYDKVAWCGNGIYLKERPLFTFDPLLHGGAYYVQEASSMFLDTVLRQYADGSVTMLDLCAAPGGKSTVARTALPEGSLLISNEPVRLRANILSENIQKFGHTDVIVTNNYPADFRRSGLMFDIVLADVPCSGEGMFRKDEGAISEWSIHNVEKCRSLQRGIVSDIWQCLKPGGLMIYSTCTFNTGENEENVRFIAEELGADIMPVSTDPEWGITGSLLPAFNAPIYRFIPGVTRGEGLFMAVLRKHGEWAGNGRSNDCGKKNKGKRKTGTDGDAMIKWLKEKEWLRDGNLFDITRRENILTAIPKAWSDIYNNVCRSLRVLHAGIEIGEVKGKDIVPSQSLALSTWLRKDAFTRMEMDRQQAISFLRKEPVELPDGTPRGFVLMTYEGFPLGFEKNIGGRANNLYPGEWKIRRQHP